MQTIKDVSSYTHEQTKSKFVCFLLPYSEFKQTMQTLKKEHSKARHFVYAYRYLNEFDQIVENQSDDGEPKNSSGKPTLNVLQGKNLINTAVITVRYFGGTKLGVGGLVRAYSKAVVLNCDNALLTPYVKHKIFLYRCSYSRLGALEYILKQFDATLEKEFGNDEVICSIRVDETQYTNLYGKLEAD